MKKVLWYGGLGVLFLVAVSCGRKKYGEGHSCRSHADCKKPLKCVNRVCADVSGNSPTCKWALRCLQKLSEASDPAVDKETAVRWFKTLKGLPLKKDCDALANKGIPQSQPPWVWKPLCGPPPIPGIQKTAQGTNPFRIIDFKISGSRVPPDDKLHYEKMTGPGHYPDVCKAWVKFEVTRRFQGRVVAQFFREYDCEKKKVIEDGKKVEKEECKLKPYERTDKFLYLYLTDPGTVIERNFYVETPPDICESRFVKKYPTGCLCAGLSDSKIELKAIEDPFLHPVDLQFYEESKKKQRR